MDITQGEKCTFGSDLDMSAQEMTPRDTARDFLHYGSENGHAQDPDEAQRASRRDVSETSRGDGATEDGIFSNISRDTDLVNAGKVSAADRPPGPDDRAGVDNSAPHVFCYQGKRESTQPQGAADVYYPLDDGDNQRPGNAAEENCCCVECGVTFANINLLLKHVQRHEADQYGSEDVYQGVGEESSETTVEDSGETSSSPDINAAVGDKERSDVACMECGDAFGDVNSLLRHVEVMHEAQSRQKRGPQQSATTVFECPVCRQTFADERLMLEHLKRHNSRGGMTSLAARPKPAGGSTQGAGPKADFNVYTRGRSARGRSVNPGSNKTAHLCLLCGDVFRQLTSLDTHYQVHHGSSDGRDHKCSLCGKVFSKITNLNIHMRLHSQDRPYECAICGKRFTQSSHLRQHELIHTQVRPFSCRFCPKMFRQSSHLHMHERIHTGLRPYKCQMCDKAFMQSSHLRIHERTHSRVRPYNCRFCNATFIQSAHMRLHEKRHLNEASGHDKGVGGATHEHSLGQNAEVNNSGAPNGVPTADSGTTQHQITA